jgi:hypothetical protein
VLAVAPAAVRRSAALVVVLGVVVVRVASVRRLRLRHGARRLGLVVVALRRAVGVRRHHRVRALLVAAVADRAVGQLLAAVCVDGRSVLRHGLGSLLLARRLRLGRERSGDFCAQLAELSRLSAFST